MGYIAEAYENDLVIVIRNKYLITVADLMQGNFRIIDNWCNIKKLSINPEKAEVLHTRKKKTEWVITLEYHGVTLNQLKWIIELGVDLDDKLMWKVLGLLNKDKNILLVTANKVHQLIAITRTNTPVHYLIIFFGVFFLVL